MNGRTRRPNVLFVMADQLAAPFLRCYGGDTAITPAIDRLAAEGVVFESAYTNSPLCASARFSMMSGQLPSRIGAYDNASELPASVPTFVHHLRAAGYQTASIGKMHFVGPDQLHGFEERLTTDIYPADFGWTPNWDEPGHRFDWWFHNMDSVTDAGVAEASNQLDFDDEVGFQAVRKLRDLARSSDDRPWFVMVSFTHPHDPYVARPELWDRYDGVEIPMPAVADGSVAHDPHSERLRHVIAADVTEVTDDQVRAARRAYFANITYVDDWIGQLRDTLDRFDMIDDTVIVVTADHGDMLGERGLWYKMSFFEHSTRVPLIVHDPSGLVPTRAVSHVSLLDITPTLLDLAGLDVPETMEGASVLSFLTSPDDGRTVVGEYLGEGAIAPIFMIRRGTRKFVWCSADPPQLYDLATDPDELVDLAGDPSCADEVAAFTVEVHERWDVDRIDAEVRASQAARRAVDRALRQGRHHAWDHQPTADASRQYMRNHLDLNDVESGRRF